MKSSYKILLIFFILTNTSFSQIRRTLNKAENAIYDSEYQKAKGYYLKVLARKPDNYKANLGMAILLTDYVENYENSLPYLQKALMLNPKKDTAPALMFALARNYQYLSQYDSAIYYFKKLKQYEDLDDDMFEKKLDKNIADCNYAVKNKEVVSIRKLYVVNAGKTINSDMPEYVPVLTGNNQLLFTSKRKDDDKEKINLFNGKYFESMYISDIHNGRTAMPKMFTIPKSYLMSKFSSSDESVISMLPDGKEMYIYKNGKIYQGDLTASLERPKKLDKVINFDYYQNHACISRDGQTIYFTSDAATGTGGNDIYKSVKKKDGTWGNRQNLGKVVNTEFDEESPYIADDGNTLYFSSKGHTGFGGFDIFKTECINGKWTKPENMGLPVNSTGNDIFFVMNTSGSAGYFSSSRAGGLGDLDIYKINYTDKYSLDCNSIDATTLNFDANSTPGERNKFIMVAQVPENMKGKVIYFNWLVNDSLVLEDSTTITYTFNSIGNYKVAAKMMAWCDTCLNPYIACIEKNLSVQTVDNVSSILASNLYIAVERDIYGNIIGTGKANRKGTRTEAEKAEDLKAELLIAETMNDGTDAWKDVATKTATLERVMTAIEEALIKAETKRAEGEKYYANQLKQVHGELSKEQIAKLGIYMQPIYFDFNHSNINEAGIVEMEVIKSLLISYPDITLSIEGFTDSKGTKKNNRKLSMKRALIVKKYLVKGGFDKTKINAGGKGENNLVNHCADHVKCDEAQHQQNRRVEIKMIKK